MWVWSAGLAGPPALCLLAPPTRPPTRPPTHSPAGKGEPTIAPVPGTTLGLLQVPGLPLGPKHRAFDTPGVPHGHQLTSRLGLEDVKQVRGGALGRMRMCVEDMQVG